MIVLLRFLAAVLVRGKHAASIRDDLDDLYARDRARGLAEPRACWRYGKFLVASAVSVALDHVERPRLPGIQWLDVKLAGRMLVRHPGLTVVAGLALATAIPLALAPIQLANAINARLPFEAGHRILGLEYWDKVDSRRATLHDFERWKGELTSFAPLAAARAHTENVTSDGGRVDVLRGAEMTASGFAVPRVQPLIGRTLIESDETSSAAPVVVIGYELWQTHFNGAPDVLGRSLRFARTVRVVVGVMPEGFLFPRREQFWVPLQGRATDYAVGQGPRLWVFGRLRDGVSQEQAQAEFAAVGRRMAADYPATHGTVRADVIPYQHAISGLKPTFDRIYLMYVMSLSLLAVACGNIGTLMLARTGARSNELAVRHALGAGRARIVTQLFVESLVLALIAAGAGLLASDLILNRFPAVKMLELAMPFWFDLGVTPSTVAIAAAFAVFSAVVAGLLPALKVTGTRAYHALQRHSTGGSALRFGAVATMLIVAEVAIAVAGLSGVGAIARGAFGERSLGEGIAAQEYLTTELRLSRDAMADTSAGALTKRLTTIEGEVYRRLSAEPGVRGVAFASELPGMRHSRARVEIEGGGDSSAASVSQTVNLAYVSRDYFDVLGQHPLMGRLFEPRDLVARGRPVVVNRSFADRVFQGEHPVGRRIRYMRTGEPGPWHEIIGVVNDLGMNIIDPTKGAGVYHVVAQGQLNPPQLVLRIAGDTTAFIPRLRTIVAEIEPGIVLDQPARLDRVFSEMLWQARFSGALFGAIAVIAIVLSAASLYALMAFTVSQRTREIAIRATLGARPVRIIGAVAGRALAQLVAGVILGSALTMLVIPEVLNSFTLADNWRQMMAGVAVTMLLIGLLACIVPTRRALRIQPIEALKEVG